MSEFSIKAKLIEKGVDISSFDAGMVAAFELEVAGIAQAARNEWVRLAMARCQTSRDIYVGGLRAAGSFRTSRTTGGATQFEISLVGEMPNNLENGMDSFDMKTVRPGWLGGSKAKTGKDGKKYITIPFRHSTGNSARMGYTGKAKAINSPDLKTQLRATVKSYGLDRMVRTATGNVVSGSVARVPNTAPVHPYLQGLTRIQQPSSGSTAAGQRGSGQLMTFRRMSENSDPSSWIHPGLPGVKILPDVEKWVDGQVDTMIGMILGVT